MFNSQKFIVTKLVCKDYGFDCEFVVENEDNSLVIAGFGKHMDEEHGIEYAKEVLMQIILRKNGHA